eukprot:symbB.v1.2.019965.t1/scaffold1632.1/size108648/5
MASGLPKYAEQTYWEKRYQTDVDRPEGSTEWYMNWNVLKPHLFDGGLLGSAALQPPGQVLELGCGHASLVPGLAEAGFFAIAADFSPTAIRMASLSSRAGPMEFATLDVRTLPFRSGTFDAVIDKGCFDALKPEDSSKMLMEACRLLVASGLFLCVSNNETLVRSRARKMPGWYQALGTPARIPDVDDEIFLHCYVRIKEDASPEDLRQMFHEIVIFIAWARKASDIELHFSESEDRVIITPAGGSIRQGGQIHFHPISWILICELAKDQKSLFGVRNSARTLDNDKGSSRILATVNRMNSEQLKAASKKAEKVVSTELGAMKAAAKKPKAKAKKNSKSGSSSASRQIVAAKKTPPPPDLPITKLIVDAQNAGKQALQLPRGEMTQNHRLVVASSMLLEASAGSLLPPVLKVPGLVVTGENTTLTLRHVCLKFKGAFTGAETLVECRSGARVELIDCNLEGAGLKLCPDSSARLLRSRIHKSSSFGVFACDVRELLMEDCEVMQCEGEGVHSSSSKQLNISDSRMAQNTLSGILVDGKPGEASVKGCTLADNGHFGIWVDSGCTVSWERNSLAGNMLGEKGGRGSLDGDVSTYSVGDPCSVWCEEKAVWLPGTVSKVSAEAFVVTAELPTKLEVRPEATQQRMRKKGQALLEVKKLEIKAKADSIRLPSGGDEPPDWSKKLKTYKRRQNAFNLFLREGGRSAAAWKALDAKEKTRYQMRARKLDKEQEKLAREKPEKPSIQSNQLVKSIAKHKKGATSQGVEVVLPAKYEVAKSGSPRKPSSPPTFSVKQQKLTIAVREK